MRDRRIPVLVLVAALVGLGVSVGWAATRASEHHYGPMYGRGLTMMGANGHRSAWYLDGNGKRVRDIAGAQARAQKFADRLGLRTGEVMQFTSNYYVLLVDRQGKPATEVLVDPRTGAVTLEYGPAMMWNTRYGMMRGAAGNRGMMGGGGMMGRAGMMGRYGGAPNWTPPSGTVGTPLTEAAARQVGGHWLVQQGSGLALGAGDALPGYFTFETLRDGKVAGMLSVNATTGAVWEHWWHGAFVKMEG